LLVVLALAAFAAGAMASQGSRSRKPASIVFTVNAGVSGPAIPPGFVGLSTEYWAIPKLAGENPQAENPAFAKLLANLAPGQRPVLRLGGDSTDWTWWPTPHVRAPLGIRYTLTSRWMQITGALIKATNARLILGINLEADSARLAGTEARALLGGLGRPAIAAFEIGNEPELYGSFGWYRTASGREVPGRPRSYDLPAFVRDYSAFARSLPPLPLAGPSTGSPIWMGQLGQFLGDERRIGVATVHDYPLKHCTAASRVTIAQLLSSASSEGLAASLAPEVSAAHHHHVPLRIDEMNSVSCGGERGVSDTYASALWALDTLFALARAGVDGVNIHAPPRSINEMFTVSQVNGAWQVSVHPNYYGMLMFAEATPAGSRLIQISGGSAPGLSAWATRGRDGRTRVVLINKDTQASRLVAVRAAAGSGPGTIELLRAPAIGATSGITLGGQSFGAQTRTGVLAGTPAGETVKPGGGRYTFRLPAASAALLTVSGI
jgi:Glycosyl hydrolase family 79 C-terminal beta domain